MKMEEISVLMPVQPAMRDSCLKNVQKKFKLKGPGSLEFPLTSRLFSFGEMIRNIGNLSGSSEKISRSKAEKSRTEYINM